MSRTRIVLGAGGVLALVALVTPSLSIGQPTTPGGARPAANSASSAAQPAEQVIIQREAPKLTDPDAYQVPLYLVPSRSLDLTPLIDGVVSAVLAKPGQKLTAQAEAVRLNPAELQLLVERAKANHRAAQIEAKIAGGKNDPDLKELAEAKLQAAKADLDLATLRLERATIRAPFNAEVLRVRVTEGELVRAGQPVVTIGDTSAMNVEIPVDRTQAQQGQTIELKVEERMVQGKVEAVMPLAERFEPLRDLINSAASAVVRIENANGELKPGQTVYTPQIPRHPIAEVANGAVQNGTNGVRKVQVVRDNVVRDIPVEILSSVGTDRVYVSGPFAGGDEVVVSTSQPLPDGSQIRAMVQVEEPEAGSTKGRGQPATRPSPGF